MTLRFSRTSYLSFGIEIAKCKRHSLQPCKFLTDNNAGWTIDRFLGILPGEERIIEVMILTKITGELVSNLSELSLSKRVL